MSKKIAVLTASWHVSIVGSAEDGFVNAMVEAGYDRADIKVIKVPGALEIPLAGKIALESGFDVAVGIGFVTDGKIYHREYVAHTVVQSILDVSIQVNKPFLSVVLAPQNYTEGDADDEAWFVDHMVIKGQEAAQACMQMLNVIPEIKV
ncbi:MAG: 6,7-dimethyl-8-ribityllumazine synthase [Alphaproteobacteria bacterium]|nr:6,7-dimethyl-8-ribityllumazine synthase [Alphaproteobacteria bacterium]